MGESVLLRSFSTGELTPGLGARADLEAYQTGLRTCRNFIVRRTGGVSNRAGFMHQGICKDEGPTFLFPWVFAAAGLSTLVEAGEFYFRFWRDGVMLQEVAHPYVTGKFLPPAPLCWHQSGLIVTLTHLDHEPMQLNYSFALDQWALVTLTSGPTIDPPVTSGSTAAGAGALTISYKVTAVKVESYEESLPSNVETISGTIIGTPDAPNVITWGAVTDAIEYRVYSDPTGNGTFGFVGTATGVTTFNDVGVEPDYGFTPPVPGPDFSLVNDYPGVNAVHAQRRVYGGTHNSRDLVFLSRVGLIDNFTSRSPIQDDDGIKFRLVTKDLQVIVHFVSLQQLVMLTDRGEWVIQGDGDHVITPTMINPLQHGYVGAGWVTPVIYGEKILFVQARETILRELGFNQEVEGLTGRDLTLSAGHLFRQRQIVSMAFALVPDAIVWCVRDDGLLLGMTYLPEEDILGWHRHDTQGGLFEQVCVLPEGSEDAVYVVVNRDGQRTIEKLASRDEAECFVDNAVLVDDAWTGVPIIADLETLDLDVSSSEVRDKRKKVTSLSLLLQDSARGFWAGPDFTHLRDVRPAQWENPTELFTGKVELTPTASFTDTGRVCIRHLNPTPLTILGIIPVVDLGG